MDGPQLKKNNNINCSKALVSPSAADRVSQPKEQKKYERQRERHDPFITEYVEWNSAMYHMAKLEKAAMKGSKKAFFPPP